jgi:hypothetical protein
MTDNTEDAKSSGIDRRKFLVGSAAAAGGVALTAGGALPAAASPARRGVTHDYAKASSLGRPARSRTAAVARRQTRVGIGYETWFDAVGWGRPEAEPILGHYSSQNRQVIRQHAEWITYAGIDHVLIDWSNNLGGNWNSGTAEKIMAGTDTLLEVYASMPQKSRPDVTLLLGLDNGQAGTANFEAQINRIKTRYLANPSYRRMFVLHDGKPLVSIYTGARPTPPPTWSDPAFTVRWSGAFREIVLNPGGQWSWVDRVAYANGVETPIADFSTNGLTGWTVTGEWAVDTIKTHQALRVDIETTAATSKPADGGDQKVGVLTSPPFTVTERVIAFNAIGFDMSSGSDLPNLDGRNVYLLRDAKSDEILRHITPPGDEDRFYVRQWNVADLVGRTVVFQAVNNSTSGGLTGWMGFTNPIQQRPEQMTAVVSNPGNEAPGSYLNWDAHNRNSGASLVEMMTNAFKYEPEMLLVQQWNEFGRPDQYSVPGSNDIEPTKITKLAGADSDGWGFYYLKLVRDLVDEYRAGRPFPAVTLDTRYP